LGYDFSLGATSAPVVSAAIPREALVLCIQAVWAVTERGTQYFSFVRISVLHFHFLFTLFFLMACFLILTSILASIFILLWQLPQPVWFTGFYNHSFFLIKPIIISIFFKLLICCHFLWLPLIFE